MPNYTKLFDVIVTSTIWSEDNETRILWITMLALADQNGEVHASIPGLARLANITPEACEAALDKFMSPDKYSRTPDDEGRRIEKIDGGWVLINHEKYRKMANDADRKAQAAERKRRQRARSKRNNKEVTQESDSHTDVTPESRQIPQAEAEAEAKADAHSTSEPTSTPDVEEDDLTRVEMKLRGLRSSWDQPFDRREKQMLKDAMPWLGRLLEDEWEILRRFLHWDKPEGDPSFQPRLLHKMLDSAKSVISDALRWHEKRKAREPKPAPRVVKKDMDPEAKAEADKLFNMVKKPQQGGEA